MLKAGPPTVADEDDETDWDEWMAMSEAEQNREADAVMREYNEMIDRMSLPEYLAYCRRTVLRTCKGWRRTLKMMDLPVIREHLRKSQRRLVMLREWRRTGVAPSSALN